jgi:hypothetical protein
MGRNLLMALVARNLGNINENKMNRIEEGEKIMKQVCIISIALTGLLFAANCLAGDVMPENPGINSQNKSIKFAQNLAKGDSITPFPKESKPGLHVDNKIGFAVPYPEGWAPAKTRSREIFRAEPNTRYPSLRVWFFPNLTIPLKGLSRMWTTVLKNYSKDKIKILYDQGIKSKSGLDAQETELEWITNEKTPRPNMKINSYYFGIKNGKGWIIVGVYSVNGKVKDEIKKNAYSIQLKAEKGLS